jgi:D-sedoheptulose 7-phosphate isomerase
MSVQWHTDAVRMYTLIESKVLMNTHSFSSSFLAECVSVINGLAAQIIESMAQRLRAVRDAGGRLFIIGSGGGAGHASHAVCDFRKLCGIEAYAPYDNISELTARVNDEGWETTISNWLKGSRIHEHDCVFVFSVGGGNEEHSISMNIVNALTLAVSVKAGIVGIVGRDGGYAKRVGDAVLVIPTVNPLHCTPLTEGFQGVIWHLLVSHPLLQMQEAKWESEKETEL